jgi:hypothetical protein
MTPFFGENGIFTSDGETWKSFRALLRPCFSTKSIITFMDMSLEGHFKDFLTCIPRDGRKFDLQPLFYKFTMDIATEFFMGRSVRTLLDEKRGASLTKVSDRDFVEAYTCASEEVVHVIRLGVLGPLRINHKAQRARNIAFTYVEQFVDEVIQQRKSDPDASPPSVFLRNLAERTGDRGVLRSQILNMLLASRDTTASALSNLWWLLSRHPDVYSELRSEVSKTLNGRCPTYSDTQSMKYLSWCINECKKIRQLYTSTYHLQLSGFSPRSHSIPAKQFKTHIFQLVEVRMANYPCVLKRALKSIITFTQCIDAKTYLGATQTSFIPSAGNISVLLGSFYLSAADLAYALESSLLWLRLAT